jgi:predicted HAD superfamily Cof-like phosphohydrolase
MYRQIKDIKEFQKAFGCNVQEQPYIPSKEISTLRISLLLEEVQELVKAKEDEDIVEITDAIVDIMYIILGTACEYGVIDYLPAAWDLVHRNNMTKVGPDGKVQRRPDGKIMKPENYVKVELKTIFEPNSYIEPQPTDSVDGC